MSRIPIIHTTDLHHSPNDPDDHFDLAAVYALDELDLRAVILDYSEDDFGASIYEPGYVPMAQLNFLTGRAVPFAVGPTNRNRLTHSGDALEDCTLQESAGIQLLIETLRTCEEPAFITAVGSCRTIAAAYNRDPDLFQQKTGGILLVAGSVRKTHNPDYNTKLDPEAMRCVWESGLPILWLPVGGNEGFHNLYAPNNGHISASYATLLKDLDERLMNWFLHALWGNLRGDIVRALYEANRYEIYQERIGQGRRNLFSLGGLVLLAGRELVETPEGWRFLPEGNAPAAWTRKKMSFVPIAARLLDDFDVSMEPTSEEAARVRLYQREPGEDENEAMTEALNALLRSIPM